MTVTPFLMFQGQARQALDFYAAVLPGSSIESLELYGPGQPGPEGTVQRAVLELPGLRLLLHDSPAQHAFTFTPSISLFIEVDGADQLDSLAGQLREGGVFLMPPDNYGFSARFAWVQDRFGVSWQLILP